MAPILTAFVPPPSPIPVNEYLDLLTTMGATHVWRFDEASGDFVDEIGTCNFGELRVDGVGRGFPGPFLGAPYFSAVQNGPNNSSASNARWIELTPATLGNFTDNATSGAIGGFFKLGVTTDTTGTADREGFHCFHAQYANNTGLSVTIYIRTNGSVRVNIGQGTYGATWQSSETPFDDGNWHFLVVSQPADGTGLDIWVDGTALTLTQTLGAGGNADYWFDDAKNDQFSPPANRTLTGVSIGGRRGVNNDFDRIQGSMWAGVFVFQDQSLTQQDVDNLLDASNFQKFSTLPATAYEEYIFKLFGLHGPYLWPGWWYYQTSSITYNYYCGPGATDFLSVSAISGSGDNGTYNLRPMPAGIPGIKYGKSYFEAASFSNTGTSYADGSFDSWVDSRTNTQGTIHIICEVPAAGSGERGIFAYHQGAGGPTRLFDVLQVQFVGTQNNIRVDCWADATTGTNSSNTNGNGWTLNTTNITSPWIAGDIIFIAVVQDGTGPKLYINGSPASNTNFSLLGTGTAADWHDDIDPTEFRLGFPFISSNDLQAHIYDYWEDNTALSAQEIQNLYDIAVGNILIAT